MEHGRGAADAVVAGRGPVAGYVPPSVAVLDRVPAEVRAMSVGQLRAAVLAAGLCVGQAAAGADPDVWFPVQERASEASRAAAEAACRGCGVRLHCLELAVRTGEPAGVWGGVVAEDRIRIARSRAVSRSA